MRVRHRRTVALTLALLALAATDPDGGTEAQDPCGDILYVGPSDEPTSLAPGDWSSFDLRHVRIAESGDRALGTHAVVVTMELCGPAVDPKEAQDAERWYRLEWPVDDGCSQGFNLGWEGTSVAVVGSIGVTLPNERRLYEVCPDTKVGDQEVVGAYVRQEVLPAGSVVIDGTTLTVTLRESELEVMDDLFTAGAVLTAPVASTRAAAAPTPSGRFCEPGATCAQVRDGDVLQLPDVVLADCDDASE